MGGPQTNSANRKSEQIFILFADLNGVKSLIFEVKTQSAASGSTEVGGVIATPNVMCRWVDRSAAEEVRTVPNGKCFQCLYPKPNSIKFGTATLTN